MPFTLSHAAAVLPFRRTGLIISASVVGTFGPDFEYFLLLAPRSRYGHHWPGVIFFTLPACLLALWLFHAVIKKPIAALLPSSMERRVSPYLGDFQFGGVGRFLHIVLSISVGIATHVVWDGFTHKHTWATQCWPGLLEGHAVPIFGVVPLYKILQHASTIFGLVVLAVWFLHWLRAEEPRPQADGEGLRAPQKIAIVSGMVFVATAGGAIRALFAIQFPASAHSIERFLVVAVITAGSLLAVEILAYSAWWRLARSEGEVES